MKQFGNDLRELTIYDEEVNGYFSMYGETMMEMSDYYAPLVDTMNGFCEKLNGFPDLNASSWVWLADFFNFRNLSLLFIGIILIDMIVCMRNILRKKLI